MPPLVRYRPGSAAERSNLPDWQQFLNSLPQAPGGGRRGPRHPKGSPEDVLQRAETAYSNKRDLAQAVGVEGEGQGSQGLLTSMLGALDAPRSFVFENVLTPALGLPEEAHGFGDLGPLQVEEGDPFWERGAKYLGAFAGDVVTDPLSYLSVGTATVGKKLAAETVDQALTRTAQNLGDDVLEEFSQKALSFRATRAAKEAAEEAGDDLAAQTADELFDVTRRQFDDEGLAKIGREQFRGAATEAYQEGGSRGLRTFLQDTLGGKQGREVFENLPRELKGGVRVRVPFARDEHGLAKSYGANVAPDSDMLDKASKAIHNVRNRARASTLGRAVMDRFGGANGDLYGDFVQQIARRGAASGEELAGTTWATYSGLKRARQAATQAVEQMSDKTQRAVGRYVGLVNEAGDKESVRVARETADEWFMNPQRFGDLENLNAQWDETEGVWRIDGLTDGVTPEEARGIGAAFEAHNYLRTALDDLREAGLEVRELQDYVPRILAEDERYLKNLKAPAKGSQARRGAVGGYQQTKARHGRAEWTEVTLDEQGRPVLRDLNPSEVADVEGRAIFETDPEKIIEGYGEAARKLVGRTKFARLLQEHGLVARGGSAYNRILRGRQVDFMSRTFRQADTRLQAHLDEMMARGRGEVDRADDAVRRAEADVERVRQEVDVRARRAEAMRQAAEAPAGVEPDVPEGMVRLYRAEGRSRFAGTEGDWWGTDRDRVFRRYFREGDGGVMRYVDVTPEELEQFEQVTEGLVRRAPDGETLRALGLPDGMVRQAVRNEVVDVPHDMPGRQAAVQALRAAGWEPGGNLPTHQRWMPPSVEAGEAGWGQYRLPSDVAQTRSRAVVAGEVPEELEQARGRFAAEAEEAAVRQAEEELAERYARDRLASAEARLAEAQEVGRQADDQESVIRTLVDAGEAEPLYQTLFRFEGGVVSAHEVPDHVADGLRHAGWVDRPMDADELSALSDEMQQPISMIENQGLGVVLEPADEQTLNRARRAAYRHALERSEEIDWQEAARPWADELSRAIDGDHEVRFGAMPEDPDELAAVVRLVEELEPATGWRFGYRFGGEATLAEAHENAGWALRNYRGGTDDVTDRLSIEARNLAMSRRLRELGYDVPEAPVSSSRLRTDAQNRAAERLLSGREGIELDWTGERLRELPPRQRRAKAFELAGEDARQLLDEWRDKEIVGFTHERIGGKALVRGTPDRLRQVADDLEGMPTSQLPDDVQPRTVEAVARRMRQAADDVEERAGQVGRDRGPSALDPARTRAVTDEPTLDDFLEAGEVPRLDPDEAHRIGLEARRAGRARWEEAFEPQVRSGRLLPANIYESATVPMRRRLEREAAESTEALEQAARQEAGEAGGALVEAENRLARAKVRRQEAARDMDDLRAEVHRVAQHRDAIGRLTRSISQTDDVDVQLAQYETLVEGLQDFHRHAMSRYADDMDKVGKVTRERLEAAVRQANRRLRETERLGRQARSGSEEVDLVGQLWQELGLAKVGEGSDRLGVMPAELDLTYAPEQLRKAVHRYYEVARPNEDVKRFLDGVYRPWFALFKTWATVGRGLGYHVRNLVGGMWNNHLADVTVADHRLAGRIAYARRKALRDAHVERAEKLAARAGISVKEARGRIPEPAVADRADTLLEDMLSDVKVSTPDGDITLYDVHRLARANHVGMNTRAQEGLHAMVDAEGFEQAPQRRRDLFERLDVDPEEYGRLRRASNVAADNCTINLSGDAAELSEEYLRTAAFLTGLRRYGAVDDGASAKLLTTGLHFDYQDLSDAERWTRNTLVPFYVWSRHNVPLQFRALFASPGKINRLVLANENARKMFGDDEEDIVPEWMRERLGWTSMFEQDGNPIVVGVESPVTDLNKFLKVPGELSAGAFTETGGGVLRELASAISPAAKLPIEAMTGTDLFTGAKFNPRGAEAPAWYRHMPGLPKRTDERGQVRGNAALISFVQDALPPLGVLERGPGSFLPSSPQHDRRWTNLQMLLAPVPNTSTLTARQKAGELRSRVGELEGQLNWNVEPSAVEAARILLEQGYPPEAVRRALERAGYL